MSGLTAYHAKSLANELILRVEFKTDRLVTFAAKGEGEEGTPARGALAPAPWHPAPRHLALSVF